MNDIPDEAVEAARQAFRKHADWEYQSAHTARGTCICGETLPETGNIHREFGRHQMTKVLEAAAPIIRTQERRRVEEAIRAEIEPAYQDEYRGADYANGLRLAAQIAERSAE